LTLDEDMSEDNNSNSLSIDDIVRELDREETNIVISKEIKKFNKPTTVVRGLGERKDIRSIARDLKMDKLYCKVTIGNQLTISL
jgi:hypothetical protein